MKPLSFCVIFFTRAIICVGYGKNFIIDTDLFSSVKYVFSPEMKLMLERRGFRGPGHLVSGADWIPGTASTPVSLSHRSDEA